MQSNFLRNSIVSALIAMVIFLIASAVIVRVVNASTLINALLVGLSVALASYLIRVLVDRTRRRR